jgi:excisionase family DNA binding protein
MAFALCFGPLWDLQPLRFLTLKQTSELLQMSTRTLLRMVQSNELPAFKAGGQWRFLESELTK